MSRLFTLCGVIVSITLLASASFPRGLQTVDDFQVKDTDSFRTDGIFASQNGWLWLVSSRENVDQYSRAVVSVSKDAGKTWIAMDEFTGLAGAAAEQIAGDRNGNIYHLGIQTDPNNGEDFFWYLRGSKDDGLTWRTLPIMNVDTNYTPKLAVTESGAVIVWGIFKYQGREQGVIMRSLDTGKTFQTISTYAKGGRYLFKSGPDNSLYMFAEPQGVLQVSQDNGATWTAVTNFTRTSVFPTGVRDIIFTGYGIYLLWQKFDSGAVPWHIAFTKDSGKTWKDSIIYTPSTTSYLSQLLINSDGVATISGALAQPTENGGASFSESLTLSGRVEESKWKVGFDEKGTGLGPIALDRTGKEWVALNRGDFRPQYSEVMMSSDDGSTWSALANFQPLSEQSTTSRSLAVQDGENLLTLTNDEFHDVIRRSLDGGGTWQNVAQFKPPLGWVTNSIVVAGADGRIYYINAGHELIVKASNDLGESWVTLDDYSFNDSYFEIKSALVDKNGRIFLGIEYDSGKGPLVRLSLDGGKTWDEAFLPDVAGGLAAPVLLKGKDEGTLLAFANKRDEGPSFVFESFDFGKTWKRIGQTSQTLVNAAVISGSDIFVLGSIPKQGTNTQYSCEKSNDSGKTWTVIDSLPEGRDSYGNDLTLAPSGEILAAGYLDKKWIVRSSLDHGKTWVLVDSFQLTEGRSASGKALVTLANGNVFSSGDGKDSKGELHALVRQVLPPP
jgi:hypothetical protein